MIHYLCDPFRKCEGDLSIGYELLLFSNIILIIRLRNKSDVLRKVYNADCITHSHVINLQCETLNILCF